MICVQFSVNGRERLQTCEARYCEKAVLLSLQRWNGLIG